MAGVQLHFSSAEPLNNPLSIILNREGGLGGSAVLALAVGGAPGMAAGGGCRAAGIDAGRDRRAPSARLCLGASGDQLVAFVFAPESTAHVLECAKFRECAPQVLSQKPVIFDGTSSMPRFTAGWWPDRKSKWWAKDDKSGHQWAIKLSMKARFSHHKCS